MKKYAAVIEKVPNINFCAYVPDLPGCVSIGDTCEEVERNIQEAIEFHPEGMLQDGDPVPEPGTNILCRVAQNIRQAHPGELQNQIRVDPC